jgi:site-specific DNA-methyltransferase (adenine-specific)
MEPRHHPTFTGDLFSDAPEPSTAGRGDDSGTAGACRTVFELHHGDCIAGMAGMPAESVNVVVTSPPYNLGIGYRSHDDTAPREEYLAWSDRWTAEVRRVLKPNGSFFLNIGAAPANPWLPHEVLLRLRPQFVLQNTLHWIKSITIQPRNGPEISAGHFKPLQGARYLNDCHEYLFHLTIDGNVQLDRKAVGVEYADKSNIARWGHTSGEDRRCRGNNWFIPYKTIKDGDAQRPHPATFPAQLAEWCIRLHGVQPDLTVLDPFFGLGHTGEGARAAGAARCIGFEVDDYYLAEAKARLGVA